MIEQTLIIERAGKSCVIVWSESDGTLHAISGDDGLGAELNNVLHFPNLVWRRVSQDGTEIWQWPPWRPSSGLRASLPPSKRQVQEGRERVKAFGAILRGEREPVEVG